MASGSRTYTQMSSAGRSSWTRRQTLTRRQAQRQATRGDADPGTAHKIPACGISKVTRRGYDGDPIEALFGIFLSEVGSSEKRGLNPHGILTCAVGALLESAELNRSFSVLNWLYLIKIKFAYTRNIASEYGNNTAV